MVGFGLDEKGRPLFAFSSLSSHTGDLEGSSRASLTVTSATFKVPRVRYAAVCFFLLLNFYKPPQPSIVRPTCE